MSRLTKAQARAFRKRWQLVNAAEVEELRKTSLAEKFRQTAALMASGRDLGWGDDFDSGEAEVWDRWRRLRQAYDV